MPKAMHEALKREAAKKGLTGEAADRYVFGTMQKYKKKKKKKSLIDMFRRKRKPTKSTGVYGARA